MTTPVWTSPTDFNVGDAPTAAQLNPLFGGNMNWLHTAKAVHLHKASAQSVADSAYAALTFDTEDYDDFACHESVTHPTRITPVTALLGVWDIHAQVEFASNATGDRWIELRKNNTMFAGTKIMTARGTGTTIVAIRSLVAVVASDYIEAFVEQTSGGSLNTVPGNTFLEATFVGALA